MRTILHHMAAHAWAWTAGLAVLGVAAVFLRQTTPAAFLFMAAGMLIMMWNEGTSLESIVAGDADEEAPATAAAEEEPAAAAPAEPSRMVPPRAA